MPPEVSDILELSDDDFHLVEALRPRSTVPLPDTDILGFTSSRQYSQNSSPFPQPRGQRSERGRDKDSFVSCNAEARFLEQCFVQHSVADNKKEEWVEVILSDFLIYKKENSPTELESLHDAAVHNHDKFVKYCFDGKLTHETGITQELVLADITSLQIDKLGGLDEDLKPIHHTCSDALYLQTNAAKRNNCFYRLQRPRSNYKSIYDNFTWLADFMKYIIDYLTFASENDTNVGLQDFQANFIQKLKYWHQGGNYFQQWHEKCGHATDFRPHLTSANHWPFICGQASSIKDDGIAQHRVWEQIGQPLYPTVRIEPPVEAKTLVTPHVAQCFLPSFPSWGTRGYDLLENTVLDPAVAKLQAQRRLRLGLGNKPYHDHAKGFSREGRSPISTAAYLLEKSSLQRPLRVEPQELVGKALVVRLHENNCCSRPCTCAAEYKFCVARSCFEKDLRVRWLTLPSQTICAGRYPSSDRRAPHPFYPIGNELFWSDQCCCVTVPSHDVVASYRISIGKDHAEAGDDLFVHRQYNSEEAAIFHLPGSAIDSCPRHEDLSSVKSEHGPKAPSGHTIRPGKVLSMYTGGGILDYGFQKGSRGVFKLVLAIEWEQEAVLSFKANNAHLRHCEVLHQNVITVLREICAGRRPLDDIACCVAGSPCQGFCPRNMHKGTIESQRKCTLLAHTLSWIEILTPKMVLLENVEGLDQTKPSAAGQAVSVLVSLGYQVKLVTIQASDYGAATRRTRIFIIATVPGIPLPRIPEATHGQRQHQTPLSTASSATTDLQPVENTTTLNPRFPDHVPTERFEPALHAIVSKIPKAVPKGDNRMHNLASAYSRLNLAQKEWFGQRTEEQRDLSKGTLRRMHPNRPYSTILTAVSAMDSRSDGSIHWSADRGVTLTELRRYQGLPDSYILIGPKRKQIMQVGNSVAVAASTMLGGIFADSWEAACPAATESEDIRRPAELSKVEELTDTEDEKFRPKPKAAGIVLDDDNNFLDDDDDDDDDNLPEMKDFFTPTPRSTRYATANIEEGDADLPDLTNLLTPTKDRSQVVKTTAMTEKLTITPRGSLHLTRNTKSKVLVRRRSPSSEDEIVIKRPRMSFKERISVNMPKRTDRHTYDQRGHTAADAIMLDD